MKKNGKQRSLRTTLLIGVIAIPIMAFMLFYLAQFVPEADFIFERRWGIFMGYLFVVCVEILMVWRRSGLSEEQTIENQD